MKSMIKHIAVGVMAAMMLAAAPQARCECEPATLDGLKIDNLDLYRAKGGRMNLDMTLVLDNIKLGSNGQVTLRPALVNDADTALFKPVTIYSRNQWMKVERGSGMVVDGSTNVTRTKGAQSLPYNESVAYEPWMDYCKLVLMEDRCGCGKLKEVASIDLREIDNRPPGAPMVVYITPSAEAEKNRDESGQAFLDFIVNKTDIQPNYRNNRVELDKIIRTINLVKDDPFVTITNINIHGFASPEGDYANNTRLATGRAAALKNYVRGLYDLPDKVFTSNATPEDWETLRKIVVDSDLPDKAQVLAIIDSDMDLDAKDHELRKQMPQTYAYMLREWYPGLRRSDYTVKYVVRPLTIEEAKQVLETNPKNLSLNEMFLVAQTYEPGSAEFNRVFEIAAQVFPDDPTANLNLACTLINNGQPEEARKYLAKAGDSPEAIHARGLVELLQGRWDEARTLLTRAQSLGVAQAADNLKILDRAQAVANNRIER